MMRTQVEAPPVSVPAVTAIELRPARMDDEQRVRAFVEALSLKSQTLRFFAGLTRPDARLVRSMIMIDERRDVLLAVDGDQRVVGHAMSFRRSDATEIAVVVADEWQGLGLGSRLVGTLLRRAVARGAVMVGMDVMGDNRKVLSIIKRWWPDAQVRIESGTVEILARIGRGEGPGGVV
ncbi:GNAT family N-acetyltransferase [Sphaerisporangium corydalis]|uniref:GNAT family N-acetyltransferase n=1 Tax=Sphaerisporangium corydalis TaxID=1441875 RepID=A0ABV9EFA6_9ACTN|nr:GNAT family N-acetyltransferase [Sphaerisporangium corydalis]